MYRKCSIACSVLKLIFVWDLVLLMGGPLFSQNINGALFSRRCLKITVNVIQLNQAEVWANTTGKQMPAAFYESSSEQKIKLGDEFIMMLLNLPRNKVTNGIQAPHVELMSWFVFCLFGQTGSHWEEMIVLRVKMKWSYSLQKSLGQQPQILQWSKINSRDREMTNREQNLHFIAAVVEPRP